MKKNNSFFLFHLNLAFSSIEDSLHNEVINKCYYPLLELFSNNDIKLGIEISGWSLNRISELSPKWVLAFKELLSQNKCELVASGYSQIIGPLVPYEVNIKNHEIGLDTYKKILNVIPETVLVNEMSYSNGVAEIYQEIGYKNMIMDGDNLSLSLNIDKYDFFSKRYCAGSNKKNKLKILPTDSIIFQKFQRYAHSNLSTDEYINYIKELIKDNNRLAIPIYCNDAEIFNFRPGRFAEEAEIEHDEWHRIENILKVLKTIDSHKILLPREICDQLDLKNLEHLKINSLSYPVPVKKQRKYNLARWAITGRDDSHLNAVCNSLLNKNNYPKNVNEWRELLYLWSSDHRTHVTDSKWENVIGIIKKKNLDDFDASKIYEKNASSFEKIQQHKNIFEYKNFIEVKTDAFFVKFNKNKGLSIFSAGLIKDEKEFCILGTLEHGFFDNIELGADFFSGAFVMQDMKDANLVTDLVKVNPVISCQKEVIAISTDFKIGKAIVKKTIFINLKKMSVNFLYSFNNRRRSRETIRLSAATIKTDEMKNINFNVYSKTGSNIAHKYVLDREFDHGLPVSHRVSSSSGLPSTDGELNFEINGVSFDICWDTSRNSFYPLFSYKKDKNGNLIRLHLSEQEIDDTSKPSGTNRSLEYSIKFNKSN